jgi:hypothetical protein
MRILLCEQDSSVPEAGFSQEGVPVTFDPCYSSSEMHSMLARHSLVFLTCPVVESYSQWQR